MSEDELATLLHREKKNQRPRRTFAVRHRDGTGLSAVYQPDP